MTARLAIRLIEEEALIRDYLKQGYSTLLIAEKMNKNINFVNLVVNEIQEREKHQKELSKKIIKDFSIKHNINENDLTKYINQKLQINEIALITNVEENKVNKLSPLLNTFFINT